jgi:DNA-binding CsgD family transcriptional regulator/tetratricopeptide (TPR) repeat protein
MAAVLEREELFGRLFAHLKDAGEGSGSLIFLTGEAGAGKTTVVKELVARTPSNTLVLIGGCDPLSTPRPLGPLLDIAGDSDSGLGSINELDDTFEMFATVLDRLHNTIRPVLMILEDVHWADAGTLDMITYLGRRISDTKAMIVATYRDDEIGTDHPLLPVLSDLIAKEAVKRYPVDLLSRRAVRELAEGTDVDADLVFAATGGNAFYVTELLATGGAIPRTVQEAVLARVGQLDSESRKAVEAVSIAPRSMELTHILALTAVEGDAPDRAVAAGVLIGDNTGYSFRHELARLAVQSSIPEPRRVLLNAVMLDQLADSNDLSRLAHHAINTNDPDTILTYVPPAARDAARRQTHHEAVGLFAAAYPYADKLDKDARFNLLADYDLSLRITNHQDEALRIASELVDLARTTEDVRLLGVALRIRSRALWVTSQVSKSNDEISASVSVLEGLGDSEDLGESLYIAANNQMLDRHFLTGVNLGQRSLEMARRMGDTTNEVRSLQALGTLELVMGDLARGVALIEESIEVGRTASIPRIELVGYSMLGTGGGEVRIYDRALDWLNRSIALARQMDEDYSAAYDMAWKARIRCEQGLWDEAIELIEEVPTADPGIARIAPVTALGTRGRIMVRRGDPGAEAVLGEALELGNTGALQHIWVPMCSLSEMHWLRGNHTEAVEVLDGFFREILETDTAWGRGEVAFWMWISGGLEHAPTNLAEPFALMIDRQWGLAAEVWEKIGCPYEHAIALTHLDTDARLAGLAIFDQLGARPASQRVRRSLREEGVSSIPRAPRDSTRSNRFGLTTRQMDVLLLLQEGLGNAEIADRLFISKKTAEHHVSAILAQLGASSRAEVVAMSLGEQ